MTFPKPNPEFAESVKLLMQLHERMRHGKDDEEADALRDQMEQHWWNFSEQEKELIRGLSADLYTIGTEREIPGTARPESIKIISNAVDSEDRRLVLELLRKHETELPPDRVAFLRGLAWSYLDVPEVAVVFFEDAVRLEPNRPVFENCLLSCLIEARRTVDAIPRATQIAQASSDPSLVLKAAEVFFVRTTELPFEQAELFHKRAIETTKRGLKLSQPVVDDEVLQVQRRNAYLHMAISYEQFGEVELALKACAEAMQFDPTNVHAILLNKRLNPEMKSGEFAAQFHRSLALEAGTALPPSSIFAEMK